MAQQTGPEYIAYCRSLGFADEEIRVALEHGGWLADDIAIAFSQAQHLSTHKSSRLSTKILWIVLGIVLVLLLGLVGLAAYILIAAR